MSPAVVAVKRPVIWPCGWPSTTVTPGLDTALVAASGVAVLLVTRRVRPRKIYQAID